MLEIYRRLQLNTKRQKRKRPGWAPVVISMLLDCRCDSQPHALATKPSHSAVHPS